jgi:hypothetical protein
MKGRHRSLAEALSYPGCDKELNAEITVAFSEEETRRTKIKGPARIPKTAKPKPRRRSTMERIADALEILAHPPIVNSVYPHEITFPANPPGYISTVVEVIKGENIRPADNGHPATVFLWPCPKCQNLNTDSRDRFVICGKCGATFEDMPQVNQPPYVARIPMAPKPLPTELSKGENA